MKYLKKYNEQSKTDDLFNIKNLDVNKVYDISEKIDDKVFNELPYDNDLEEGDWVIAGYFHDGTYLFKLEELTDSIGNIELGKRYDLSVYTTEMAFHVVKYMDYLRKRLNVEKSFKKINNLR